MPKIHASKGGRGPRIRDEELDQMLTLYHEGKSFKAIATNVGRHWQTVRKYTLKALKEKEGEQLRREALKEALVAHFQDLAGALNSLSGLLQLPGEVGQDSSGSWQPPVPERRNRLLLQALQESHARESPLWALWGKWNKTRSDYDRGLLPLRKSVTSELTKLHRLFPGTSFETTNGLTGILVKRGVSLAQGGGLYDPSMLRVSQSAYKDSNKADELWLAQYTQLAAGQDMAGLKERLSRVMEDMGEWAEVRELSKLYQQMSEIKDIIEEEIEVLSLRRAFPGHCRLCPV